MNKHTKADSVIGMLTNKLAVKHFSSTTLTFFRRPLCLPACVHFHAHKSVSLFLPPPNVCDMARFKFCFLLKSRHSFYYSVAPEPVTDVPC